MMKMMAFAAASGVITVGHLGDGKILTFSSIYFSAMDCCGFSRIDDRNSSEVVFVMVSLHAHLFCWRKMLAVCGFTVPQPLTVEVMSSLCRQYMVIEATWILSVRTVYSSIGQPRLIPSPDLGGHRTEE
ncbi:hypothetical protein MUK42_27907 [Musa troglodytarum]|uniref:Uncharacterized protein n=1 Tax=Musa troglodytarum TaxID=320322 RepID=A0A9E7F0D0_9LILI|nr:hypothetical protein MUK42_27907 [Musa troglodytarum]